jgi:uncharacterized membrane protein YhaH (DUF805 family)
MSIVQMLFSFEGRMRRRDFWLCVLGLWVVSWVLGSFAGAMFWPQAMVMGGPGYLAHYHYGYAWPMMSGFWGAYSLVGLVMLWPSVAIGVKRCHDRDQSGLWLLLLLIPVIGWFWWLINLGLLDGTAGPNKFGPSPKGLGGPAAAAA